MESAYKTTVITLKTIMKIVVLVIVITLASGYAVHSHSRNKLTAAVGVSAEEQKLLTREIEKFFLLPKGEMPTIATVTDKSKLKGAFVFKDAENGDKLLTYKDAKRLILYRPTKQLIITIASIYDNGQNN